MHIENTTRFYEYYPLVNSRIHKMMSQANKKQIDIFGSKPADEKSNILNI